MLFWVFSCTLRRNSRFIAKQNKCGGRFLQHGSSEGSISIRYALRSALLILWTIVGHGCTYRSFVPFRSDSEDTVFCCTSSCRRLWSSTSFVQFSSTRVSCVFSYSLKWNLMLKHLSWTCKLFSYLENRRIGELHSKFRTTLVATVSYVIICSFAQQLQSNHSDVETSTVISVGTNWWVGLVFILRGPSDEMGSG
jgi:hypothetical protein